MAVEGPLPIDVVERFVIILSPFAPHIAEELWAKLGHTTLIAQAEWPQHDPALLARQTIDLPIQIMGKVRGRITVAADADPKAVEAAAIADERVQELLEGKQRASPLQRRAFEGQLGLETLR